MNINYEYYKVFYVVAECGSVSKAAEILMNSQPNLTRTIKLLENELGCDLFTRTPRGMKLTADGQKLYEHIGIALRHIRAGEEELTAGKGLEGGAVTLGTSEVALNCLLLPVLRQYRTLYPGVRIYVTNYSSPQAIDAVKNGIVDFAVVTATENLSYGLERIRLKSVEEVAVCSEELNIPSPVSVKELQNYPLISLNEHTSAYGSYSRFFSAHGAQFLPRIEVATADQILPMVRSGLGVGFVPKEFLRETKGIKTLTVKEGLPERDIVLFKRPAQKLGAAAKKLEALVLAQTNG